MLKDGTKLHLASFCLEDSALHLAGTDDLAFTTIKAKYSVVLGGPRPAFHRTAVWSSSTRQVMHRCRGRAL